MTQKVPVDVTKSQLSVNAKLQAWMNKVEPAVLEVAPRTFGGFGFWLRAEGAAHRPGVNFTRIVRGEGKGNGFVVSLRFKSHLYRFRFRRKIKPSFLFDTVW